MANDLVHRAVKGLKYIGRFPVKHGDDPHPLDCSLAGRVSHVFCIGMTRAIELCRDCGEDPHFDENKESEAEAKLQAGIRSRKDGW